jgi:hypothetical protein
MTLVVAHMLGEKALAEAGITNLAWDNQLLEELCKGDPNTGLKFDAEYDCTNRAALWGCNAITIKAAAQLTADSECFQYFSVQHRNKLLKAIQRAVRGAEPQQEQGTSTI